MSSRKHAVEPMEILDFLKEIMESVSDPLAGGTIDVEARVGQDDEERHCLLLWSERSDAKERLMPMWMAQEERLSMGNVRTRGRHHDGRG